jgi:hypothetical protein
MPDPIRRWSDVPPELRKPLRAAVRCARTRRDVALDWVRIVLLVQIVVVLTLCAFFTVPISPVVFASLWCGILWVNAVRRTSWWKRLADVAPLYGLVVHPGRVNQAGSIWRLLAPAARGPVDYNWVWVTNRRAWVEGRLGKAQYWRYVEEMNRRRLRVLLVLVSVNAPIVYGITMLLGPLSVHPWVSVAAMALVALVFAGVVVASLIYEAFRPTWAALNALGVPTCMRCGYDLRHFEGQPCPECGTLPSEEAVWRETLQGAQYEINAPLHDDQLGRPVIIRHPGDVDTAAGPARP